MAASYASLIAAWNGATQPPTGVVGTALTGAMTTAQKIAAVNAWTVTATIPGSFYVTGDQLVNCINWAEFATLTATQQANLLMLCSIPGQLLGGNTNVALLVDGMFLAYFANHSGPTITNLTALANAQIQPWWEANGYTGPFSLSDAQAAGLT